MSFVHSKGFKYFKNLIIGLGAAVVLLGALFKIQSWPYASEMLTAGLVTEAVLFALLGIIGPEKDYYWEKMYPNLDTYNRKKVVEGFEPALSSGGSATQELDKMLESSNINQNMIDKLGDSLKGLGSSVDQLSNVTSTLEATDAYSTNAMAAADALGKVASSAGTFNVDTEEFNRYQEQVANGTKNLAALNAVYELELQDTNNHLKSINKFYGNLSTAISNLDDSLEDTQKYKEQMADLTRNLSSLNSVYGNILSAMQANR